MSKQTSNRDMLKRRLIEDSEGELHIEVEAQPNISSSKMGEQCTYKHIIHDIPKFYTESWFSKILPIYRKSQVDLAKIIRSIEVDFAAEEHIGDTRTIRMNNIVKALLLASLWCDCDPGLVRRILDKANQVADMDSVDFEDCVKTYGAVILNYSEVPTFESEREYRTLYKHATPVDLYVKLYTARLFKDQPPFNRLDIDLTNILEAEKRLSTFGDLKDYYRFISDNYTDMIPEYMLQYWASEGESIDFVPDSYFKAITPNLNT